MKSVTTHHRTFLFTPSHFKGGELSFEVIVRSLSYQELSDLDIFFDTRQFNRAFITIAQKAILNVEELLEYIARIQNTSFNYTQSTHLVDYVDYEVLLEIGAFVLNMSKAEEDFYKKLEVGIDVTIDKRFATPTWNCELCRDKKLDRTRNCGFLGEKDKDKTFSLPVGEKSFSYCPIYDVDTSLTYDAIQCYKLFEKGVMPNPVSFYDQTQFFVLSSQFVSEKVKLHEIRESAKTK